MIRSNTKGLDTPNSEQENYASSGKQSPHADFLDDAHVYTYQVIDGLKLNAYIFYPRKVVTERSPVIAFFNGGLWDNNNIKQFVPHCLRYASLGIIAIIAEYRNSSSGDYNPIDAVRDARSFTRWLRLNSQELRLDENNITLSGASSGAHLALCCALDLEEKYNHQDEDIDIPVKPQQLILFEPVTDTTRKGVGEELFPSRQEAKALSPVHQIKRKSMPPCLIFHGSANRVCPFSNSARFAKIMKRKKNICELIEYEGEGSGFFNFNVSFEHYESTLRVADHFLSEQGALDRDEIEGAHTDY